MTSKNNKIQYLFYGLTVLITAWLFFKPAYQTENTEVPQDNMLEATIQSVVNVTTDVQSISLEVNKGEREGEIITIENDESMSPNKRFFQESDQVMLLKSNDTFYIGDYLRSKTIFILFFSFLAIVLMVTKTKGFGTIFGMFFTFLVLFKLVLPEIMSGTALNSINPVLSVIKGCILIVPVTFYVSHGLNKKTTVAIFSTAIALIITAFISEIFVDMAHITGTSSEEISFLTLDSAANLDLRGLVLAGVLISILGVLDDITIAQSAVVEQLKSLNPKIQLKELYTRGMEVGRDHIFSMVNTLLLVYAGASLPLLLLFLDYNQSFSTIINYEFMAMEIIRTIIGSIGLVLAVPITTLLAARNLSKKQNNP